MFQWLRRRAPLRGGAVFRGSLAPRAEEFAFLRGQGIAIAQAPQEPGVNWRLNLVHPQWGQATLTCYRDGPPPVPAEIVDLSVGLTEEEARSFKTGGAAIWVEMHPSDDSVLRQRKQLLRFVHAVLGADGVGAIDWTSQLLWSPAALADELAHDADLDVTSIHVLHAVQADDSGRVVWLHSHGLAEVGGFDFDVINPHQALTRRAFDALRAIAFAILEGRVSESTPRYSLADPGGEVGFVDVRRFNRKAAKQFLATVRDAADPAHNGHRAVLCDPLRGGLFSRWFGRVQPSRFLSTVGDYEEVIFFFSTAATELMAERARRTYPLLRRLAEEFARFEPVVLLKLGCQVDGGGPTDREHLWFKVHELFDSEIDATLVNDPFQVSRLHNGDRGRHPVELMSDWAMFTPAGMINPRDMTAMRLLRDRGPEIPEERDRQRANPSGQ